MELSTKFICASDVACSFENNVCAPYFRKSFTINKVEKASVLICGLGFYEIYVNGKNITKGALAPYISNPDDICYYDSYDVTPYLLQGENVIGILLGNGFFNPFGGAGWDFQKAPWLGAPRFAMSFYAKSGDDEIKFDATDGFKTHNSPITFDEYRMGTRYDARFELDAWCEPGFDDSDWSMPQSALKPRGEFLPCKAEPIVVTKELEPVSITKRKNGYLYDFGVNLAGVCRLKIEGCEGQRITLTHGELLDDSGDLFMKNIIFQNKKETVIHNEYEHKDIYTCRGNKNEIFVPSFTYHGFRYVLVEGINDVQATKELLTYLVMNSDVKERGSFVCSDEVVNALQTCTRRSDLANFYYFPTDCPQREKNGWTGDASMSAEHMLINLTVENSLSEWLHSIRKAQAENGALPGIIPTSGWGFEWGNGPAWDSVIVNLPYYIYKYTGDKQVLYDNANAIFKYLNYITTRMDENGLLSIGLGDWCQPKVGNKRSNFPGDSYLSPLKFTDTAIILDMCKKSSLIFEKTGQMLQKNFADSLHAELLNAIRTNLIDTENMLAIGNCQTSQALAIEFDIFTDEEKPKAYENLIKIIHDDDDFMITGMIGARYIFHVLAKGGDADLALKMITRKEMPSYGNWIANGATSMWEHFTVKNSRNHHFFGDISAWFIRYIAGIKPNPNTTNIDEIEISPCFIETMSNASAHFDAPKGRVESSWKRENGKIVLSVTIPNGMYGKIRVGNGFAFEDGADETDAVSGTYIIIKK